MANTNTLLKQLINADTLKGIAKTTGIDADDVSNVLAQAVPTLLAGASKQSTGKSASSFVEALTKHAGDDTTNITKFLKNVDLEDGAKIVSHLVGKTDTTASKIAKKTGVDTADVTKILSTAAPLVMSVLGQQTKANAKKVDTTKTANMVSSLLGNDDVMNVASSLIGSLSGAKTTAKTVTKAATKTTAKTSAKKAASSIDAGDVVNLLGKLMK